MLSATEYPTLWYSFYFFSAYRPEEDIWSGTPGKRGISGAGSAATVSTPGGDTSSWGKSLNYSRRLKVKKNCEIKRKALWIEGCQDDDR